MSTEFFNDQWRIPSNENQNKVSNYSMDFNGSSDKIEVQDASNKFGFSNNIFSLSAWVFIDSVSTQNGLIAKRNLGGNDSNKMWYFEINTSSQLRFLWYNTVGGSGNVSSTDTIPLNTWTHVVVTSSGAGANGLTFYINGTADSGGSKTGPSSASSIQQTGTPLWVGARGGTNNNQYTNGKIDQVTIFDYELSPIQVASLGLDGYAFNFIPNDYIDFGYFPLLSGATSATVSLWYNRTRVANEIIFDFLEVPAGSGGRVGMQIHSNGSYVYINGNNYNHPSSASIGDWANFVLVFNGAGATNEDKLKIYLDGTELTGGTYSGTIDNAIGTFTSSSMNSIIGGLGTLSGVNFQGELSNVAIFNSNLLDPEIATLYNNGKPSDISSLNPVGWWKLDDTATFNSGTSVWTIPDASTNSNNGASVGMALSSLVASNIDGELISNPMALSPKPIAYYQLGDQSVDNGANYLVPNNSLSDYVFNFTPNDHIAIANSTDFNFGTGDFTISFWVNFNNFTPYQYLFDFRDSNLTSENVLTMYMKPTTNTIVLTAGGIVALSGNSGTGLTTGVWNNIIVKRTNTQVTSHINGATADQTSGVFGLDFNTTPKLNIGARGDGAAGINGKMSNFQVFNTALPQTGSNSIETIYNNGSPLTSMSGFTSLVAWYKLNAADTFDGTNWTIKDYAGSDDGTSSGMTSANLVQSNLQHTSGYSPYALDFDGINDYLDANRTVASNLDFSVSAWINPTSHDTVILGTRGLASAGTSNGITMNINASGNLWGRIFTETSNITQVQTGSTISLNNWSHVAMTYDSSTKTLKTYLNGAEVGSIVGADLSVASTADLDIGRASIGVSYGYFDGSISNVSVFNTELTSTEVTEIYNEGVPSNLNNFSGTAPVAWWQLGSNSSFNTNWTCLDEIGTNNAVSVNMTNDDITNGPGYSASGLGTSSIDIKGDAPYSTANGLSENMDVLDRTTDIPS